MTEKEKQLGTIDWDFFERLTPQQRQNAISKCLNDIVQGDDKCPSNGYVSD